MYPLIEAFLQICLLRRGPQDLPRSTLLLYLVLGLYALAGVMLALAYQPIPSAIALSLTDTALLSAMTGLLLYLYGRTARVVQTLSALAGTGFLLALAALVPTWWWTTARASGADASLAPLALLALVVWSIAVAGHILRHALSAPFPIGLIVAVVFYWLSASMQTALFPPPG